MEVGAPGRELEERQLLIRLDGVEDLAPTPYFEVQQRETRQIGRDVGKEHVEDFRSLSVDAVGD